MTWAELALFSAPIIEQFFDPAEFNFLNSALLSLCISYWIYTKYDNGVIMDDWIAYYWAFGAAFYVYALNRMYGAR